MTRSYFRPALAALVWFVSSHLTAGEPPRVRVETLDEELVGELERLDQLVVLRADTNAVLPIGEVLRIDFLDAIPAGSDANATGSLELIDGSTLRYAKAEVRGGRVAMSGPNQRRAEAPIDAVRVWRLDPGTAESSTSEGDGVTADRLVVKRQGGGLAEVEGVVLDVTDRGVRFALDPANPDGAVTAGWRRLAAIRFFRPSVAEAPRSGGRWVQTRDGNRFAAERIALVDDDLTWTSATGAEGTVLLASVESLDLAGSRVTPLGELPLESFAWNPFFVATTASPAWRRDESFAGTALTLRFPDPRAPRAWPGVGVAWTFRRGIALKSQTTAVFRLPPSSRRLKGWVGLDPAYRGVGSATVSLQTDERTLWEDTVDGATRPVPIDAPLAGARTLTLRVDYGANLDTGDLIHFADFRVIQ